jgi:hypothetical protein
VFPVRYGLDFYVLFRRNSVLKVLSNLPRYMIVLYELFMPFISSFGYKRSDTSQPGRFNSKAIMNEPFIKEVRHFVSSEL